MQNLTLVDKRRLNFFKIPKWITQDIKENHFNIVDYCLDDITIENIWSKISHKSKVLRANTNNFKDLLSNNKLQSDLVLSLTLSGKISKELFSGLDVNLFSGFKYIIIIGLCLNINNVPERLFDSFKPIFLQSSKDFNSELEDDTILVGYGNESLVDFDLINIVQLINFDKDQKKNFFSKEKYYQLVNYYDAECTKSIYGKQIDKEMRNIARDKKYFVNILYPGFARPVVKITKNLFLFSIKNILLELFNKTFSHIRKFLDLESFLIKRKINRMIVRTDYEKHAIIFSPNKFSESNYILINLAKVFSFNDFLVLFVSPGNGGFDILEDNMLEFRIKHMSLVEPFLKSNSFKYKTKLSVSGIVGPMLSVSFYRLRSYGYHLTYIAGINKNVSSKILSHEKSFIYSADMVYVVSEESLNYYSNFRKDIYLFCNRKNIFNQFMEGSLKHRFFQIITANNMFEASKSVQQYIRPCSSGNQYVDIPRDIARSYGKSIKKFKFLILVETCSIGGVDRMLINRALAYKEFNLSVHMDVFYRFSAPKSKLCLSKYLEKYSLVDCFTIINEYNLKDYDYIFSIDDPSVFEWADKFNNIIYECHTPYLMQREPLKDIPDNIKMICVPSYVFLKQVCEECPNLQDRCYVLPNPVYINEIAKEDECIVDSLRYNKRIILSASRMDNLKNTIEVLDIFRNIVEEFGDNFLLILVGYIVDPNLFDYLNAMNIISKTIVLPPAPYHKLINLLELVKRHQGFFISSSKGESFGLSVAEAIVSGLPVLLSDIPAHRALVNGDADFLYSLGDINEALMKFKNLSLEYNYSVDKINYYSNNLSFNEFIKAFLVFMAKADEITNQS